jgi:hypothetical protein
MLAAGLWLFTILASGIGILDLVAFAGPGMVLIIAADFMSHVLRRDEWTWHRARAAAVVGGTVFPPVIGLLIAWSATFQPMTMAALMISFAWVALLLGLSVALVDRGLHAHGRRRSPSHVRLLDSERPHAAD